MTTTTNHHRQRRRLAAMALQATTEDVVSALRDLLDAPGFIPRFKAQRAARAALARFDAATVEMAATIEAETDRHLDALEPRVCECGEPTGSVALDACANCPEVTT